MWSEIQLCVVGLMVICVFEWIRRYLCSSKLKISGIPLPPGSMGLPFIGEALSLLVTSYSLDLHPFIKTRIQRYGLIFRTRIIGQQIIVSADPEVNHYILHQEGNMVELWYLDTFSKIIGLDSETQMNSLGAIHKYTRNTLLKLFGAENLKQKLLPEIEELVSKTLISWSSHESSVEVRHSLLVVLINFVASKLIGYDAEKSSDNLSEIFANVTDGFVSFPLNIPGTTYRKCVKGKEKVFNMLRDMLKQRRSRVENDQARDVLDQLSSDMDTQKFLTENFILHFIYITLFASTDTILAVVPLVLKLLEEHPLALQELQAEHESILINRENPESPLTWDEYKSMSFTHQVINETLRLTNILPGLLRRAVKDIPIKGFIIPAGWTIMLVTSSQHLSSNTFKEPLKFNPWRWKDLDSEAISKNFLPFGRGARQCPGAEYARAFLATFLHVLVTKYRWTKVKGGKVSRNPMIGFGQEGMHINFSEK